MLRQGLQGQRMLAFLAVVQAAVASAQSSVRFKVGMAGRAVAPDGVHLAGSFQGWNPTSTLMAFDASENIYSVVLTLPPGEHEFKFLNGNVWEDVPEDCASGSSGNRALQVLEGDDQDVNACFGACAPCTEVAKCRLFNCPAGFSHKAGQLHSFGNSQSDCCQALVGSDMVEVVVRSAGFADGNTAEFWVRGQMIYGTGTRGLTVLELWDNLTTKHVQTFDTFSGSAELESFLGLVAPGRVVLIGAVDEASTQLGQAAKLAIVNLGGTGVQNLSWRASYALVGVKGGSALAEDVLPTGGGFAVAVAQLKLRASPPPSKTICEARSAEPPASGTLMVDGNLVLDAGCRYELRNQLQATACLQGTWVIITGSSNAQLMFNTLVMMLAPAEADVMRSGRFGSRDLMDIIIEDGRIIYFNTLKSSVEICKQVDSAQAQENEPACKALYAEALAAAPEYSSRRTRITFFMSFFWARTYVAADLVDADAKWSGAEVALLAQVCAWYLVCNSMQCDCCPRPELRTASEDTVLGIFRSEMDHVLTRLETFCAPSGRAGLRGCVVGTNSWSDANGALGTAFDRFNAEVAKAMRSRNSANLRYLDIFALGAAMPEQTTLGHGSQVLHQWTWQILLGGFCSASAASEGSSARFSGPICFSQQYSLELCPIYHDTCTTYWGGNCPIWQCGNSVLCTLQAVDLHGPAASSTSTTSTTSSLTTVSLISTTAIQSLFLPVDNGINRACRGVSTTDNSPSHYTIDSGIQSLDSCKQLCSNTPACVGIEYSVRRCEVWTRREGIQASIELSGSTCLRKVQAVTTTTTNTMDLRFAAMDGGVNRACRGTNTGDNSASYYLVVTGVTSLENCKEQCIHTPDCAGIEFSGTRCEVWTREGGIEASIGLSGYTCLRYTLLGITRRRLSLIV